MSIDFFTLFAEIFNFVVLMLLLKHFLYGPIVRTMDEREQHITVELDEAERKEREATEEAEGLRREREELEDRRGELLTAAREDAEKRRDELLQQARDEVEARKTGWQAAIEREKESFLADLRQRAGEQVYVITRRVLTDLADIDLERHIINTFIKRLRTIKDADLDRVAAQLTAAAATKPRPGPADASIPKSEAVAVISTAFPIDDATREQIAGAVHDRLSGNIEIRFEEARGLISGIELKAKGYKAAWSLQNYLETLDENLSLAFSGGEEECRKMTRTRNRRARRDPRLRFRHRR